MKPLPPMAISATGTHSPPLPTDRGAALASLATVALVLEGEAVAVPVALGAPAGEALRRMCEAAAGPSNSTATNEKATTKTQAAAWAGDTWAEREGRAPTTWAREAAMRVRATVVAIIMAERRRKETGCGGGEVDGGDDDDEETGEEVEASSLWSI
jgi:hypothetical protein